jgi:hypothetical protein
LIGVLLTYPTDSPQGKKRIATFSKGLADAGWVNGRNYRLELRWASPQDEFIRNAAAELIRLAPDVPITPFLNGEHFDAETKRAGSAVSETRRAARANSKATPNLDEVRGSEVRITPAGPPRVIIGGRFRA